MIVIGSTYMKRLRDQLRAMSCGKKALHTQHETAVQTGSVMKALCCDTMEDLEDRQKKQESLRCSDMSDMNTANNEKHKKRSGRCAVHSVGESIVNEMHRQIINGCVNGIHTCSRSPRAMRRL